MIRSNKKINSMFDIVINKDLFNYNEEDIYSLLINSFMNEVSPLDIKNGETIMIFTEDITSKFDSIKNSILKNKNICILSETCNNREVYIELKNIDTDSCILIIIKKIIFGDGNNLRGYRAECVVIDINNDENYLFDITEEIIKNRINPMNIYAKEDKPCHGIMLFYNKRK